MKSLEHYGCSSDSVRPKTAKTYKKVKRDKLTHPPTNPPPSATKNVQRANSNDDNDNDDDGGDDDVNDGD